MPSDRIEQVLRSIASNVRRFRRERKLTQEQLSELAAIDLTYLRRVEGASTNLSVGVLVRIADALGVQPAVLFRPAVLPAPRRGRPRKK